MKTTTYDQAKAEYEELPPVQCALVSHRVVYAISFCCGAVFSLFVMAVL